MCLQSDHSGGAMMSMSATTALHCTAAIESDTNQLLSHFDSTHLVNMALLSEPLHVSVQGTQAVDLSFPCHRAPSDTSIHVPEYGTHC